MYSGFVKFSDSFSFCTLHCVVDYFTLMKLAFYQHSVTHEDKVEM